MLPHAWFRQELMKIQLRLQHNESPEAAKEAVDQILATMILVISRAIAEQGGV